WGPRDPHILPRMIARNREGRLRIVGDGTNRVSITYVDNAVVAHLQAAAALQAGAACAGRAYFVNDPEPIVLWDWLNRVFAGLGLVRRDQEGVVGRARPAVDDDRPRPRPEGDGGDEAVPDDARGRTGVRPGGLHDRRRGEGRGLPGLGLRGLLLRAGGRGRGRPGRIEVEGDPLDLVGRDVDRHRVAAVVGAARF